MTNYIENIALGHRFKSALFTADWTDVRNILTDDAEWILPGDNAISAPAIGAAAVVARLKAIAAYGVHFDVTDILVSRTDMALAVHNTAVRNGVTLDERLATICRIRDGRISSIETFLSDVPNMDAFFI